KKDLIYLDSYLPLEAKRKLVREMLKVCLDLGFPVFINEKSPLVLRDLDILKKIDERSYVNIGFSIISAIDNEVKEVFEPCSPPVKARFDAMRQVSDNNIMVGTVLMPILPFISDDEENIKCVVKETKVSGGKYVLDAGLTLSGYCKTRYYQALERFDPSLIVEYNKLYNDIEKLREYTAKVHRIVVKYCKNYDLHNHIPRPIEFY
ncbi:MAG: hypothetical protein GTN80_00510, partial [Nitrososphaeria archaeon]|nr:hypothetical protein [Nitrososphaeria archaeon]NIQ32127.1 hypothetical protein [Nitrososphaeria archaeon]